MPGHAVRPCLRIRRFGVSNPFGRTASLAVGRPVGVHVRVAACERICERNAAQLPVWRGTRRDGMDVALAVACKFETPVSACPYHRLAHNPEVAGSNPVPATSENGLRGATSGAIFMPDGNVFGNSSVRI